ncbi:MAG: IS1182 family transposase [Candidatus Scalindua sp.]|nr:IS1182 family transposase [Candidatus Scalindua sp.]
MAYRYGNRHQMALMPKSIEEYVSAEDPVRAYDAFMETLDLEDLGIEINLHKVGNAEYDPKAMIKLFIYGYSYGWKSCRKLERAIHHNLSFIWLMGGLKPDYKTISEFRRKNKKPLKGVLKKCVRMCIELDLIEGNVLFVDGTKIRANAGRGRNYTRQEYERQLQRIDQNIDKLLEECERIDEEEGTNESQVKMRKELVNNKSYRTRIQELLNRFKEEEKQVKPPKTINQTDPESAMMGSVQGTHASYNVQSVVDDKYGLIAHTDVVSDVNDSNQFSNQIIQTEEVTGKECEICCGDAGYANTSGLERIDRKGAMVIVPSQRQALHNQEDKPFSKDKFDYDKGQDCYYCPEGHKLVYAGINVSGKSMAYRINDADICKQCSNFGECTNARRGRKIVRLLQEEFREKLERQYEHPESQEIYKRRKSRVEHPFGHIKRNLGMTNFLLRGKEGVQAELSIAATCFNIARMITLFGGVKGFIGRFGIV